MVPNDGNSYQDVFAVDLVRRNCFGKFGIEGEPGDADSSARQGEEPSLSFVGNWIAFSTSASNLGGCIIIRNLRTAEQKIIAKNGKGGVGRPAISPDGGYVVFASAINLMKNSLQPEYLLFTAVSVGAAINSGWL